MTMLPDDACFCDLAPLYALDGLSEAMRRWVEAQVAEIPDLAAELTELQAVVNRLPYAAPSEEIAPDLKARLFQRLELELPPPAPPAAISPDPILLDPAPLAAPQSHIRPLTVRSQALKWRPFRIPRHGQLVPGISVARLHVDLAQGRVRALMRAEAGATYPRHRHGGDEEIYMLQGDLCIGEESFAAGDYIRSPQGSSHELSTVGGCMFLILGCLEDEYPDLGAIAPES